MTEMYVSECRLVEGGFALLVQFILFLSAIMALAFKWWLESPRRSPKVWLLDVSKQGFGAGFAHVLNIMFAWGLAAYSSAAADQCAWYFINFTADTFFGTVISWYQFKLLEHLAFRCRWKNLMHSGDYGDPPDYGMWSAQVVSWTCIVFISKGMIAGVLYASRHRLNDLGLQLAQPFRHHPDMELLVVMVMCPLVMNLIQFWIFDNVLKGHTSARNTQSRVDGWEGDVQLGAAAAAFQRLGPHGYSEFRQSSGSRQSISLSQESEHSGEGRKASDSDVASSPHSDLALSGPTGGSDRTTYDADNDNTSPPARDKEGDSGTRRGKKEEDEESEEEELTVVLSSNNDAHNGGGAVHSSLGGRHHGSHYPNSPLTFREVALGNKTKPGYT
eukprot:gb/GEZN01008544.1/.p1 GENE.gb/GEZN01008544.1/~~gb/GEZN01008544.1/.p1  ORF type:complete len:387 (-),score=57.04 gb/GEZN01008544.1/:233-1393(-)